MRSSWPCTRIPQVALVSRIFRSCPHVTLVSCTLRLYPELFARYSCFPHIALVSRTLRSYPALFALVPHVTFISRTLCSYPAFFALFVRDPHFAALFLYRDHTLHTRPSVLARALRLALVPSTSRSCSALCAPVPHSALLLYFMQGLRTCYRILLFAP